MASSSSIFHWVTSTPTLYGESLRKAFGSLYYFTMNCTQVQNTTTIITHYNLHVFWNSRMNCWKTMWSDLAKTVIHRSQFISARQALLFFELCVHYLPRYGENQLFQWTNFTIVLNTQVLQPKSIVDIISLVSFSNAHTFPPRMGCPRVMEFCSRP